MTQSGLLPQATASARNAAHRAARPSSASLSSSCFSDGTSAVNLAPSGRQALHDGRESGYVPLHGEQGDGAATSPPGAWQTP
jgi:hypothetical protein